MLNALYNVHSVGLSEDLEVTVLNLKVDEKFLPKIIF